MRPAHEPLRLQDVRAVRGRDEVLHGISLEVAPGQVVVLTGPNGAGKSTLLGAITGSVPVTAGVVAIGARPLPRGRPHEAARRGVAHVAEGRRVFPSLTVEQNLRVAVQAVAPRSRSGRPPALDAAWDLFPRLAERRGVLAGVLSGGEQQMLVVARALVVRPRHLLLDEPTTGLSGPLAATLLATVRAAAEAGEVGVLLADQAGAPSVELADHHLSLQAGRLGASPERPPR